MQVKEKTTFTNGSVGLSKTNMNYFVQSKPYPRTMNFLVFRVLICSERRISYLYIHSMKAVLEALDMVVMAVW